MTQALSAFALKWKPGSVRILANQEAKKGVWRNFGVDGQIGDSIVFKTVGEQLHFWYDE